MPPGPAFNWFCVAHSVVDILSNAAHIRASQLVATAGRPIPGKEAISREWRGQRIATEQPETSTASLSQRTEHAVQFTEAKVPSTADSSHLIRDKISFDLPETSDLGLRDPVLRAGVDPSFPITLQTLEPSLGPQHSTGFSDVSSSPTNAPFESTNASPPKNMPMSDANASAIPLPTRHLQSSKVPASRIGRLFHYGGLAASLGYGAASELLRRSTSSEEQHASSLMLTEANIKRLVAKLTQLRGAALKLGQFMSIQDSHVLPPEVEEIFRRVQDSAHYMPDWQMEASLGLGCYTVVLIVQLQEVLRTSLGPSWADHFESFDRIPFAAASIGQVHSAVLAASSSPTGAPAKVAVKIQFPNIANSIETDLGYVKMLLTAGRLLPKGLFLDRTIQVMKAELADECDYSREASFLRKFGLPSYLGNDPDFKVPWAWDGSSDRVLVMEHVDGVSVGGAMINSLNQRERNDIATRIIDLCLRELFSFRLMQTDPNWTNFLWNSKTRQIQLVDFGATREYSKEFMDNWLRLLQAAASDDKDGCIEWSLKLGYLTGEEDNIMLDAHVQSMTLLATPFKIDTPQPFSFGANSQWTDITTAIRAQIPVMLQHRLTPPPRETYSLNRKLSGAFLLAARLNASVDCKVLWDRIVDDYQFG
ncbi:uncharacterized protein FIBRA_08190 [Fibroporia radiculosa]|uniref:ABC1 atypical kinase-like domain-containing protein n=1 Tax=Fibroporia radiculosa TaxID=599839 RepID=J4IC81_9APHY|nr:uncharacterized protein FIBRA_08190 [Fibroporia radiculosa]CCM05951.1 predicted protein [Fibroporia radiculosa]